VIKGSDLNAQCTKFLQHGEIGIISYTTLSRNKHIRRLFLTHQFDLLIADEAHYIKNSGASRTKLTRFLIDKSDGVILLTGTPIENHIHDMTKLIGHLNPSLHSELESESRMHEEILPTEFMHRVASVYLRRRTRDVLHELPEKLEKLEWCQLSQEDWDAYKNLKNTYHEFRQAASIGNGTNISEKLQRLKELLTYYYETGEKVIVFSFYLKTLSYLQKKLQQNYVSSNGPRLISGKVPIKKRYAILDAFSTSGGHDLLLAQINSAGTGLNIQAASVVVIYEPQFKPSIENQAIARAYRMGQSQKVKVHRMVATNTVDELILARNDEKVRQFRLYADDSIIKQLSAVAVQSEFDLAKKIEEVERKRIQIDD
jgi:SNF2 family DNA or RNA helicase